MRDQLGQRVNAATVRFIARDGGTLDPPGIGEPGTRTENGTSSDTIEDVDTNSSGEASVRYTPPDGGGKRTVSASLNNNPTKLVTFTINGTPSTGIGTGTDTGTTTPGSRLVASSSSISGAAGSTQTVTIRAVDANNAAQTGVSIALDPNSSFVTAGGSYSSSSGSSPFSVTLTLPSTVGSYGFSAGATGLTGVSISVTVTGGLGTLDVAAVGAPVNGQQTIEVTARNADGTASSGSVTVTLSGAVSRTVETTNGSGRAIITLPTTATYTVTLSADGYATRSVTLSGAGQTVTPTPTPTPPTTVGAAESLEISGQRQRDGTVDAALDASLRVRVVDANGNGVPDVRVIYRVLSPGRGTFAGARGSGRAVSADTNRTGYASANFTPTTAGNVIVQATASGVRDPVTFIIDVDGASTTTPTTPGTGTTPATPIDPKVLVGAANRPAMYWIDGGMLYGLTGSEAVKIADSVNGAAVGGGKIYWTSGTGNSGGSVHSANLDGSQAKQLTTIFATPLGIAVDTANSQLYWTNSAGRVQSANLNGKQIQNVVQNRSKPMDIALGGDHIYWTEEGSSIRRVPMSGAEDRERCGCQLR